MKNKEDLLSDYQIVHLVMCEAQRAQEALELVENITLGKGLNDVLAQDGKCKLCMKVQ